MNTTLKCPSCGEDIAVNDALAHQLQEETERIKKTTEEKTRKLLAEEFDQKEKVREKEIQEERKKTDELIAGFEKKMLEEEEKIKEEVAKEAADKYRLEKLEYEKRIADMQKAVEEAQRKGKQGSQQLQGEVLELDLEDQLKAKFPYDEFLPVPKGVEGGDIWQKVKDAKGNDAGSIMWETKRAKSWDKKWLRKLREDMGRINASESILVSQILPGEVKSFHYLERVWVTNFEYAIHVARIVRFLLLKTAAVKTSTSHTDEDLEKVRDYLLSDAFRHKINMHHDTINLMMEELTSEVRLTQIRWKKREAQIKSLDTNIAQLDGELQGIMGPGLSTKQITATLKAESDSDD